MLSLRPIVVDENFVALGGNMRQLALKDIFKSDFEPVFPADFSDEKKQYRMRCYEALKKGFLLDEWVVSVSSLTEEQKREFVIKDNNNFGDWDFIKLAAEWETETLGDWGLEIPSYLTNPGGELDHLFEDEDLPPSPEKNKIVLEYSVADCAAVKTKLAEIAGTPEQAVWQLLGL